MIWIPVYKLLKVCKLVFKKEVGPQKGERKDIVWYAHLTHRFIDMFCLMNTMTNDMEEIARHYLCSIYVLPVGKDFSFHTSFTTSYSNFTQLISWEPGIAII